MLIDLSIGTSSVSEKYSLSKYYHILLFLLSIENLYLFIGDLNWIHILSLDRLLRSTKKAEIFFLTFFMKSYTTFHELITKKG
jgi:hypothetical protein